MVSKAQVSALCAGDSWLEQGANLLLIGPPGGGKSHLSSAIGLSLLEKGWSRATGVARRSSENSRARDVRRPTLRRRMSGCGSRATIRPHPEPCPRQSDPA
jgi:chromosomal replication initiation ATPase DnaA